jgi:hypothetical protein
LELNILGAWNVPSAVNFTLETYQDFRRDVEHYKTIFQIRHSRRRSGFSVRFDTAAKQKIRHHLQQIRVLIDKLEVDVPKREALYARLTDLETEVDRDRTRFEVLGAFLVGLGGVVGEATELSGINRLLENIARVFWGAKQHEDTAQLPPPRETKRIEPPRRPSELEEVTGR